MILKKDQLGRATFSPVHHGVCYWTLVQKGNTVVPPLGNLGRDCKK